MGVDIVNDIEPRVQYTASAAQTEFDYPFPIFADADLVVDVDGITQALTTDYTVSGAGADAGGTITFLSAMTGGEIVTIYRDIALERLTDFQQNGPLASASFNDELDRLVMIAQQLQASINRALRLPFNSTALSADAELSPAASWLGKYVYINASGVPEPATSVGSTTLSQSVIAALLMPQTSAEAALGVTPSNYAYPQGDVRRYGAAGDGSTDDSGAANIAANVVRYAQEEERIDTTTTPAPALTFGGGLVYRVNSTVWLGTADTTASGYAKQHVRTVDLGGSTVVGFTSGEPIFDWSGGYEGVGRMLNGKIVGAATSTPNIGVLLARSSEPDEGGGVNAQNADPRHFVDVQIIGHFTLAALYDYAAELLRYTRGKLWNFYSSGAPALIITNDNVRYGATSPNVTLSDAAGGSITDAQSCIDFKFWGTDIQNKASALGSYNGNNFQAQCIELWGVQEATFDGCFINGSVDNHHLCYSAENASVQPERIVFQNGSFHSDNGTGASIKCGGTHGSLTVVNNRNVYNTLVDHSSGLINRLTVFGNDTKDTVKAASLRGAHLVLQDEITVTTDFNGYLQTTGSGTVSLPTDTAGLWVDYAGRPKTLNKGSFTGTLSGVSGTATGTIEYSVNGDQVTLYIPQITGTSNTTAASITGFPSAILPATAQAMVGVTIDNGVLAISKITLSAAGTLSLYNGVSATFTGSGTKGVGASTLTYRVS